jgi:hypothetical protein
MQKLKTRNKHKAELDLLKQIEHPHIIKYVHIRYRYSVI